MAGWIKVEHITPDKPEIITLAGLLAIDQDAALGKAIRFWIWADQQSEDGNALSVTDLAIDRIACCPGFASALQKVGWLKGKNGRYVVPNFDRHNGESAKKRALTRNRVKRSRNAGGVTNAFPEQEQEIEQEPLVQTFEQREAKQPKGKRQRPEPPSPLTRLNVDEDSLGQRAAELLAMLPPTKEDTRIITQLAWLLEAGAPIWPAIRDAAAGTKQATDRPDNPIAYFVSILKASLGDDTYKAWIAQPPSRKNSQSPWRPGE